MINIFFCLYSNDIMILSFDVDLINDIKKFLSYYFDMKDLVEIDLILGMKIIRSPISSISKSYYTQLLIDKFSYSNFSPVSSPFDPSIQLLKNFDKPYESNKICSNHWISSIVLDLTLLILFLNLIDILVILVGFIGLLQKESLYILKIPFHIILDLLAIQLYYKPIVMLIKFLIYLILNPPLTMYPFLVIMLILEN